MFVIVVMTVMVGATVQEATQHGDIGDSELLEALSVLGRVG
jgi:hypothetical protein